MAISDSEYEAWLADDENRDAVVLFEIDYNERYGDETLYLSDRGFVDHQNDRVYEGDVISSIVIDETLDGVDISDIEIINKNNEKRSWWEYIFEGYDVTILHGDRSWDRSDFKQIAVAKTKEQVWSHFEKLTLKIEIGRNYDALTFRPDRLPLHCGKIFNGRPQLTSTANRYCYTRNYNPQNVVVRDNGVVLTLTTDYTLDSDTAVAQPFGEYVKNHYIDLVSDPAGQITVDFDDSAGNSIYDVVKRMCGLTSSYEVPYNDTNLQTFDTAVDVGFYLDESAENVTFGQMIKLVAQCAGASRRWNTDGELEFFQFVSPGGQTPDFDVTKSMIRDDPANGVYGVTHIRREMPVNISVLKYKRNWTIQSADALASSVSEANRDLFSKKYSEVSDDNNIPGFLAGSSDRKVDTLIFDESDAEAENTRRQALREYDWNVSSVATFFDTANVKLGDVLSISTALWKEFYPSGEHEVLLMGKRVDYTNQTVDLTIWHRTED